MIISTNATSATDTEISSATGGRTGLRMPRALIEKKPNAATAIASSTVLARLSDPLPAISVHPGAGSSSPGSAWPTPRSSRRSTTGTITTFKPPDSAAST